MSAVLKVVLIHIWLAFWVWFCVTTIWGQMAQRTYDARMRFRWFLMPGTLRDRAVWAREQRALAWVALVFAVAVYVGVIVSTLG